MSTTPFHTTSQDPQFLDYCSQVAALLADLPIPGVSLGVWYAGQEHTAAFGTTSVENPLPVTPDTLFQVGSITKTFVATAVMRLVEQGRLALDAPLRAYLPGLQMHDPQVGGQATMRHVLSHTGGWLGDYFDDFGWGDDALGRMVARVGELPQITPLGEVYSYNNAGFYLAGRVLEVLTGQTFEAAMQSLVLDPLGLSMTFFSLDEIMTRRFATGHDKQARTARPWAVPRAAAPAGGIVSTVPDLLRYARFHSGELPSGPGEPVLSPESLALMQTPVRPATGISWIGLSWRVVPAAQGAAGEQPAAPVISHGGAAGEHPAAPIISHGGAAGEHPAAPIISHGGATNGQNALLQFVPSRRFAVVFLTNSDEGYRLYTPAAPLALERFAGISLPPVEPLPQPEAVLEGFAGDYDAAADQLHVRLRQGELVLEVENKGGFPTPDSPPSPNPPPVRLGVYATDRVVVLDDPLKDSMGEFVRNPDGSIAWFRFFGRVHKKLGSSN